MHDNVGIVKEKEFVKELNNKKVKELSNNLHHMIREIFGLVDEEALIKSALVEDFQKPDFYIEINQVRKYISLKSGSAKVIAQVNLKTFIYFLRECGISKRSQQTILYYQFGDGTLDGSGKERFEYNELRVKMKDRIIELNKELNSSKEFLKAFIYKFMFKGSYDENIQADYICHGDVEYCVVCSMKQIFKHLERKDWVFMDNPHIGPIQFRPHARYYNKEVKNERYRWEVEMWWANLSSDMRFISERYNG